MTPILPYTFPSLLAYWTHNLNPVLFHIAGPLAVRWYGLAYLAGFLGGYVLLRRLSQKGELALPPEEISNFIVYTAIFGVFIGGRLGYVLLYCPELLLDFSPGTLFGIDMPIWGVLKVWDGGMASHGGMVGVIGVVLWTAWKKKVPFWNLTDALAFAAPIGLFFGRIANFINGELWGRPTDVAWAVIFPHAPDPTPTPRHPSQLYEAFGEGLLLFTALWLIRKTSWGKRNGVTSASFLLIYAVARIVSEFFRTPDEGYDLFLGWMTKGQLYSTAMIIAAVAIFYARKLYRPAEHKG